MAVQPEQQVAEPRSLTMFSPPAFRNLLALIQREPNTDPVEAFGKTPIDLRGRGFELACVLSIRGQQGHGYLGTLRPMEANCKEDQDAGQCLVPTLHSTVT